MSSVALQRVSDESVAMDVRLPAPVDKVALSNYLTLLEDPEALKLQNRLAAAYDNACRALIGPNDIQKDGGREFKKKSAWKKLARHFSISTTIVAQVERFINDESTGESVFVAICTVRATSPWGQVADSVGACGTDEETGKRKISIADAISTAETRASNRATSNLIAMGEVSAEETTREEREQLVQEAAKDMTLAEAKLIAFPWRQPAKYAGKPLGELSPRMLKVVLDAVVGEIGKAGESPRRVELKRAAEMLLADVELRAEEERLAAAEAGTAAPSDAPTSTEPTAAAAPIDTTIAPGRIEDALEGKKDPRPTSTTAASDTGSAAPSTSPQTADASPTSKASFTEVTKQITSLLSHEKIGDDDRGVFKGRMAKATTLEELQKLAKDLQNFLDQPF